MGMDCVALNPASAKYEYLHANWSGWSCITELVEQLGVPTRGLSGSNDRERVSARTSRGFGRAIHEAVKSSTVLVLDEPDSPHETTMREHYLYGPAVDRNELRRFLRSHDGAALHPLTAEDRQWLLEWADFFLNCGGFEQG